jgi:hypothetical protein
VQPPLRLVSELAAGCVHDEDSTRDHETHLCRYETWKLGWIHRRREREKEREREREREREGGRERVCESERVREQQRETT